jgi:hypothetical protein
MEMGYGLEMIWQIGGEREGLRLICSGCYETIQRCS